ncbi:MAG: hypothetical protein H0V01_00360 [Bacteroidetes bacterium]|nr:hypothetical protein [Bacteroidota bacterium]HET6245672.1 hypothetical protein [Bacteroidia bacterium]
MELKPLFLLIFILNCFLQNVYSQNGLRIGAYLGATYFPFTGSGSLFESPNEKPHGEYGVSSGFALLFQPNNHSQIIVNSGFNYHRLHFHYMDFGTQYTGTFNYSFLSGGFSYNKSFPFTYRGNVHTGKIILGLNINSQNFSSIKTDSNSFSYKSSLIPANYIQPEFFAGLGIIKKLKKNIFHLNLTYNINPIKQINYKATVGSGALASTGVNNQQTQIRKLGYHYAMLNLMFFPKTKKFRIHRSKDWSICE